MLSPESANVSAAKPQDGSDDRTTEGGYVTEAETGSSTVDFEAMSGIDSIDTGGRNNSNVPGLSRYKVCGSLSTLSPIAITW